MSDDDRDIDIESDDENDSDNGGLLPRHNNVFNSQAEKRAHHNALERKRRDHIKESFTSLREAVPSLKGEKASRAQILKKTTECIQSMRQKIHVSQREVDDIRRQNAMLEEEIRHLENARKNCLVLDTSDYTNSFLKFESQQDCSDDEEQDFRRCKKMRTSP